GLYQWAGLATRGAWGRLATALPSAAASAPWRLLRILFTFHLILFAWIFFRAESTGQALTVIRRIATALPGLPALAPNYPFTPDHALGAALIVALIAFEILDERRPFADRLAARPAIIRWSAYYCAIFALILIGRWQSEAFIYMQF